MPKKAAESRLTGESWSSMHCCTSNAATALLCSSARGHLTVLQAEPMECKNVCDCLVEEITESLALNLSKAA
jgi:hypothetical protein